MKPKPHLYTGWQARLDALGRRVSGWRKRRRPFYRRYALDWDDAFLPELDRRIAVAAASRVVWIRVPKAANSTVAWTLWCALNPGASPPSGRDDVKRWFGRPSDLSEQGVQGLDDCYKFMVVRNPFTRVLAAYLEKAGHRKYGYKIRQRPVTPGRPPVDFPGFCDYLAAGGVHDDPHWCVQASLSPFPIEALDTVAYVESLEADLGRVVAALDPARTNPLELVPAQGHATAASTKVAAYYGERERRLVAELYAEDFARFGYDPERLPA